VPTDTPTSSFAGPNFDTSIDNQKRALLAAMAERGAEGAQAFKTAQQTNSEQRQASLNQAAARGAAINAPESLNAELNTSFDAMSNVGLGDSALSHDREMARITAANTAYLDQMKAAGPMREQYYNAELAKIAALQQNSGGGGSGGSGVGGSTPSVATPDNPYNFDPALPPYQRTVPELGDYFNSDPYIGAEGAFAAAVQQGGTRQQAMEAAYAAAAAYIGDDGLTNRDVLAMMTELSYRTADMTSDNMPARTTPVSEPGFHTYDTPSGVYPQGPTTPYIIDPTRTETPGGLTYGDRLLALQPTPIIPDAPDTRDGTKPNTYVRRGPL